MSSSKAIVLKAVETVTADEINNVMQALALKQAELDQIKSEQVKHLETEIEELKEKVKEFLKLNGITDIDDSDTFLSPNKAYYTVIYFKGGKTTLDPEKLKGNPKKWNKLVADPKLVQLDVKSLKKFYSDEYEKLIKNKKYTTTSERTISITKTGSATPIMINNAI